ncbi:hypothetical protein, partial [Mycobacterium sherrisii]
MNRRRWDTREQLRIAIVTWIDLACSRWLSPDGFGVLWPEVGPEGTMKHMAGRERHSAEDIVR